VPPTIDEFVALRGEALLRFALMLTGSRPAAEDLVQAVLAHAYPRWGHIRDLDRPEAYLKRMVVNQHLRWHRRLWRGEIPTASPGGERPPTVDDGAEERASRDETWRLLAGLPRRQRAVLVLRYYEDLSDTEIAMVLGCRPATVRSQAARALATLRAAAPNGRTATDGPRPRKEETLR